MSRVGPSGENGLSIRPIVMFPDQRLREAATPIVIFDASLHALAGDLLDTMRAAPGVGITAPHIGVMRRVVVLELPGAGEPRFYVNPALIRISKDTLRHEEGSVSMPGVTETVERAASVTVRYQDLAGAFHEEKAEGFRAACHQHEIDQLNGRFWLLRLSALRRGRLMERFEKQRRADRRQPVR